MMPLEGRELPSFWGEKPFCRVLGSRICARAPNSYGVHDRLTPWACRRVLISNTGKGSLKSPGLGSLQWGKLVPKFSTERPRGAARLPDPSEHPPAARHGTHGHADVPSGKPCWVRAKPWSCQGTHR